MIKKSLVVIPLRINITNNGFLFIVKHKQVVIPLRINITNNSLQISLQNRGLLFL